jgi:Ni2+-binding GTPase involved in maturation of urease and hydrogenase
MTSQTVSLAIPKRGMSVTIITGFLGSGKTTLLNPILTNNQDLKVAVLVNEFGDIDIDRQLLVSVDQDMVQLSNGCICCTIAEGGHLPRKHQRNGADAQHRSVQLLRAPYPTARLSGIRTSA